jgi:hypothetical protein
LSGVLELWYAVARSQSVWWRAEAEADYDKNDRNVKSPLFGRLCRFGRTGMVAVIGYSAAYLSPWGLQRPDGVDCQELVRG